MPCNVYDAAGATVIACTRGRTRCATCRKRDATRLCDGAKGSGTCEAPMCARCATRSGDRDYCPACAREWGVRSERIDLALPRSAR